MAISSPSELLGWLKQFQFLTAPQIEFITPALPTFADCHALAKELIERDWLTPYQVNQILTGKHEQLILGDYRIRERLGEGAMGQVFKAWSVRLERLVAVKTIHKGLVNPNAMVRFRREMETASRLDHPNIALVRDADEADGRPYLVLDFVDGVNLALHVKQRGPLPIAEAVEYVRQTALGLQHAFERGIVHRDIKPANLLVTRPGGDEGSLVKILDFGLARFESENEEGARLTQLGSMLGTVDYVAPEQAQNSRAADVRADIYSLGCTLFYLLTARPPFPGSSAVEKLGPRVTGDPPRVRTQRPEIDAGLDDVLAKMMARRPDDRYQTPIEVAQALQPYVNVPAPPLAMPVSAIGNVGEVPMAQPIVAAPVVAAPEGTTPTAETLLPAPVPSQETVFAGMSATGRDMTADAAPAPAAAKKPVSHFAALAGGGAFLLVTLVCAGACVIAWSFFGRRTDTGSIRIVEARYSVPSQKLKAGGTPFVLVKIERIDFKGPVTVSLHDLPDGVRSKSKVMPESVDQIDVSILVSHGTEPLTTTIRVRAENEKYNISAEKSLQLTVVADSTIKGK